MKIMTEAAKTLKRRESILLFGLFLCLLFGNARSWAGKMSGPQLAVGIPTRLVLKGIKKVGNINLEVLIKDISAQVQFGVLPVFTIGAGTEGSHRTGSSCYVEGRRVLVNEPHIQQLKERFPVEGLLLHESLCALGWDDSNYLISATLGALDFMTLSGKPKALALVLALIENSDFTASFNRNIKRRDKNYTYEYPPGSFPLNESPDAESDDDEPLRLAGGSVTGVGGGGDGFGWMAKVKLTQRFFEFSRICREPEDKSSDSKQKKFDIPAIEGSAHLNCRVIDGTALWTFLFSVDVEKALFKPSKESSPMSVEIPSLGSVMIENIKRPFSSVESRVKVTLDELRWMRFESDSFWKEGIDLILLHLLVFEYPQRVVSTATPSLLPFSFKGSFGKSEKLYQVLGLLPAWRCREETQLRGFDGISYIPMPLSQYQDLRDAVPLRERYHPPHCVYRID